MSFEDRYIDILVAWHKLEQKLEAPDVIDFNLLEIEESPIEYSERRQVQSDFEAILQEIEDPDIHKKVVAHITYLRALQGDEIPFEEYIAKTQHMPVKVYDKDYIDEARKNLIEHLQAIDVEFGPNLLTRLEEADEIIPPEKIETFFREQFALNKTYLEKTLGQEINFNLKIELVNVDAYWSNWVDGSGTNFRLRINYHHIKYTRSRCIQLVYHELLAHCAQMTLWKQQIAAGKMSKVWGLTTVHGPEQFGFEGLAQTLPRFIENDVTCDPTLQTRMELSRYSLLNWNNLHVWINTGKTEAECMEYGLKNLPWLTEERILTDMDSRKNHMLFRSYQYVYPGSMEWFWKKSTLSSSLFTIMRCSLAL